MEEEMQSRLFQPFFTTKATGRGLGLPAVLGIVRGHRGAIRIESEHGKGSAVRVLLPPTDRPASLAGQIGEARFAEDWAEKCTVLVVDDEAGVRNMARAMVESLGLSVLLAADGEEGVQAFQKHADEISLVLLDMTMPRMSGEEAFRQIRQIRPDAKVILSSGYDEEDTMGHAACEGSVGFLKKPYELQSLVARLHETLHA